MIIKTSLATGDQLAIWSLTSDSFGIRAIFSYLSSLYRNQPTPEPTANRKGIKECQATP
jgi:hypothetical protein